MKFDIDAQIVIHQHHHHHGDVMDLLRYLKQQGERIMSAISDFADKMKVHNDKIDVAVDGIGADVDALKQMITDLQNNPGPITPADQALLDQIEARLAGVATKVEALDAMTPPTPPPG